MKNSGSKTVTKGFVCGKIHKFIQSYDNNLAQQVDSVV